jgi:hypothetical protein
MMINQKAVISRLPMVILLAVAFCLPFQTYSEADANSMGMQAASTGGVPYLSFTGIHNGGNNNPGVIYTVPIDRIFILTGLVGYTSGENASFDIYENNNLKVLGTFLVIPRAMSSSSKLCESLCANQAVIPFAPGSEIKIQPTNGTSAINHYYMIQGYLANPG